MDTVVHEVPTGHFKDASIRLECGSTDRPESMMGRRGRVPAHAPPVLVLLRVPAKRGRVDYASTTAFYSSTGSPEDVPSTHATDGTAQQGGTIARCSFCGKVSLQTSRPHSSPPSPPAASTPRQFAPVSVEHPRSCSCSKHGTSRTLAGGAATASLRGFLQFGRAGDFFPEVRQCVLAVWSRRLRGAAKVGVTQKSSDVP